MQVGNIKSAESPVSATTCVKAPPQGMSGQV